MSANQQLQDYSKEQLIEALTKKVAENVLPFGAGYCIEEI